jgi:hypothetical protein
VKPRLIPYLISWIFPSTGYRKGEGRKKIVPYVHRKPGAMLDAREMGVVSLSFPFLLDSLLAAGLPRRLLAASERSNRKDYSPLPILYHFSSF